MGKIALLVSREEMIYQAHNILQEKKYEIDPMKVIHTRDAVSEARQAVSNGASIIIARGLQASLIKQYTNIPVAEIVITAQEMALLVMRAKQILKKHTPVIAVVGFRNMFCDMSYFDTIYDIDLRTYFADKGENLKQVAMDAVADEVDLIIGGDTAVGVAAAAGVPSLFLSITEDSMRNAFSMAESMNYAMGAQKRNQAQMETLLDNSFSGVARMDGAGIILDINPMMEDLLQKQKEEVLGQPVGEVFRELDRESLRQVLEEENESYSFFMQMNRRSVFANIAAVVIDGKADGAILTCHRMKKIEKERDSSSGKKTRGLVALGNFDDLIQYSPAMQKCIRLAKLCALSEKPVLIMGEAGTEKRLLAQSIHNAGLRGEGPFVNISCDGIEEEAQLDMIFGDKGAVSQAVGGSILIEDIGYLTRANQYRLYQLLRYRQRVGKDVVRYPNDARVMVTSGIPLRELMRRGDLREDLYYLLEGLTVVIPPMRERPQDLEWKIDSCLRACCEHYSRYHVLTKGARQILLEYEWRGNMFQIENFCERLILTANKRSLDETAVRMLLKELYGEDERCGGAAVISEAGRREPEEAIRIRQALEQCLGNRERTAGQLGISKATLWRRMKQYGIEMN